MEFLQIVALKRNYDYSSKNCAIVALCRNFAPYDDARDCEASSHSGSLKAHAVTPKIFSSHFVLKSPSIGKHRQPETMLTFVWRVVILNFINLSITSQCFTHHFQPQPKLPMRR